MTNHQPRSLQVSIMLQPRMLPGFVAAFLCIFHVAAMEEPSFDTKSLVGKDEFNALAKTVQELNIQLEKQAAMIFDLQKCLGLGNQDGREASTPTASSEPDVEERLTKLESLARVGDLRSCEEYSRFGIRVSGQYTIDTDGLQIGEPPFEVMCLFDIDGGAVTELWHDSEQSNEVVHCHDPGCFTKNITYTTGVGGEAIPLSQIEALISISSECTQSFSYECTLAPLRDEGIDYAFWKGRDNSTNVYFTGKASEHACDCHFTQEGCVEQDVKHSTCNCDANIPLPLTDTGVITNKNALPMLSISFGGLYYNAQRGVFRIGRLSCRGEMPFKASTSCKSLKRAGQTKSGFYTIKKEGSFHTQSVFCDMSYGGYMNVPETAELSTDSPLGTIAAWIPKNNETSGIQDLPDGWLPCNGANINKGPWTGGKTPYLNTEGRFLRGGTESDVLQMQDDQLEEHEHTDPGHTHSNSPHTHSYEDQHTGNEFFIATGSSFGYGTQTIPSKTTSAATVKIEPSLTNLGGITSAYRSGHETRPKNMKVIFIIRCW